MTTVPAPTYRSILRSRNIRLLFAAQSISFLGTWISLIALNVKAYNLTQSSLGVSAIFLLTALPSLLFGLIGSVYVDRIDRKKLLIAADIARLLITVLIVLANNILLLYLLTFLCASAGMIYRMARLAIVPQLALAKEELLTINALLSLTQTLTLTVGPAVGGVIIAYLGVGSAFALDAATFAVSAVLIARMIVPGLNAGQLPSGWTLRHLQEGFRFVSANRAVRVIIVTTSAMMLGTGTINALEIVYARAVLHVDDTGFGLLVSSWGLGLLLGTLVVGRLGHRYELGRVFILAMGLLGVMLSVYAYVSSLSVAVVIGIIGGASNGVLAMVLQTLLQRLTPADLLGRVGGFFTIARDVTALIAMVLAGLLADIVGVQLIFFVAGLLVIAASLLPLVTTAQRQSRLDWLVPAQHVERT